MSQEIFVYHMVGYNRGTSPNEVDVSPTYGYGKKEKGKIHHISYRISLEALAIDVAGQIFHSRKPHVVKTLADADKELVADADESRPTTLESKVGLDDAEWNQFCRLVALQLNKKGNLGNL